MRLERNFVVAALLNALMFACAGCALGTSAEEPDVGLEPQVESQTAASEKGDPAAQSAPSLAGSLNAAVTAAEIIRPPPFPYSGPLTVIRGGAPPAPTPSSADR